MGHQAQIQYLCLFVAITVMSNCVTATPFNLFDFGFGDDDTEDDGASASVAGSKSGSVSLEGPLGGISAGGSIGGAGSVSVGDQSNQGHFQGQPSGGFGDNSGANTFTGAEAGPQGAGANAGADAGSQPQQFQIPIINRRPQQRLQYRGPPVPPPRYYDQPPPRYHNQRPHPDPYYQPQGYGGGNPPHGYYAEGNPPHSMNRPGYPGPPQSYQFQNQNPVYNRGYSEPYQPHRLQSQQGYRPQQPQNYH